MKNEHGWQAKARVKWLGPEEGGRVSGPPTGATYSPTVVFDATLDAVGTLSSTEGPEQFSVVMGIDDTVELTTVVRLRFLAPDLVASHIFPGSQFLVMEGPTPVGQAKITALL
jgi:hypothetical protein